MQSKWKNLVRYFKYLSPVWVKRYECEISQQEFLHVLRLNTQSAYSTPKQDWIDRRIGRRNNLDTLTLNELHPVYIIKKLWIGNHPNFRFKIIPATLIRIKEDEKFTFDRINYPGNLGSLLYLLFIIASISILFLEDISLKSLAIPCVFFFMNFILYAGYNGHNQLIDKIIETSHP